MERNGNKADMDGVRVGACMYAMQVRYVQVCRCYAEVRCMLYDVLCNVRYAGRAGGTECRYVVCAMQICTDRQVCAMQQAKLAKWVKMGLRGLKIGV